MSIQTGSTYFTKKKASDTPLADCLAWSEKHCIQNDDYNVPMVTPLIVMCRKVPRSNGGKVERRYFSKTIEGFESMFTRLKDGERHFDEVVCDGPCKLFCDLELAMDEKYLVAHRCADFEALKQKLNSSSAALIDHIVAWHKREHNLDVEPIVTTAHKESKWSMHVTFDGAVWRDSKHCKHYIVGLVTKQSLRDPLLTDMVDRSVYEKNHVMRTYRSSKHEEPNRLLLAPGETIQQPVNLMFLRKSLITCIRAYRIIDESEQEELLRARQEAEELNVAAPAVAPQQRDEIYLSTMFMRLHITDPSAVGVKYISAPGYTSNRLLGMFSFASKGSNTYGGGSAKVSFRDIDDLLEKNPDALANEMVIEEGEFNEKKKAISAASKDFQTKGRGLPRELGRHLLQFFEQYEPYGFKIESLSCVLAIACKSRDCAISGRTHKSNHVFIVVDLYRKLWRLRCHDDDCQRALREAGAQWNVLPEELGDECQQCTEKWQATMQLLPIWSVQSRSQPLQTHQ